MLLSPAVIASRLARTSTLKEGGSTLKEYSKRDRLFAVLKYVLRLRWNRTLSCSMPTSDAGGGTNGSDGGGTPSAPPSLTATSKFKGAGEEDLMLVTQTSDCRAVLLDVLDHVLTGRLLQSHLMVLEDTHMMDPCSWALLADVADIFSLSGSMMIMLSTRPMRARNGELPHLLNIASHPSFLSCPVSRSNEGALFIN